MSTIKANNLLSQSGGAVSMSDEVLQRPKLKDYSETLVTSASSSGTLTLDLSMGNTFHVTLTENVTSIVINNTKPAGVSQSFTLKLEQGGAGSYTVTFPASVKYDGGAAPTLVTAVGEYDRLGFVSEDGGTTWDLVHAGGAFA